MRAPFSFWLALTLAACSGSKASGPGADGTTPVTQGGVANQIGIPSDAPGDWVKEFDLNKDDKPDVFHHFVQNADGTDRLIRKDMDINWDGRTDIWRWYDERENIVKEEFDLDFDGRIDVVNFYDADAKLIRKESDLDFDGRPDLWKYYEEGKLVRKERDTSGDGRVDYFEYYEDGEIDRIGEDIDGDGTVDRWTKRSS